MSRSNLLFCLNHFFLRTILLFIDWQRGFLLCFYIYIIYISTNVPFKFNILQFRLDKQDFYKLVLLYQNIQIFFTLLFWLTKELKHFQHKKQNRKFREMFLLLCFVNSKHFNRILVFLYKVYSLDNKYSFTQERVICLYCRLYITNACCTVYYCNCFWYSCFGRVLWLFSFRVEKFQKNNKKLNHYPPWIWIRYK